MGTWRRHTYCDALWEIGVLSPRRSAQQRHTLAIQNPLHYRNAELHFENTGCHPNRRSLQLSLFQCLKSGVHTRRNYHQAFASGGTSVRKV
jgi:hypothetical protein